MAHAGDLNGVQAPAAFLKERLAIKRNVPISHNMLTPQREVTAKFLPTMKFQVLWAAFLDV